MKPTLLALALLATGPALAVDYRNPPLADTHATVTRVDPGREKLRLFLDDAAGAPFKRFDAVATWLDAHGQRLVFAMNAGMYEPDRSPVGLFVADGKQRAPLNTKDGVGNFYLKPNGVFFLRADGTAGVLETARYAAAGIQPLLATQSGPLLVDDGIIHPAFNPHSTSRLIRNGVGVDGKGAVIFAISDGPVSLYEFAAFFRDTLHCANALYLDGTVSSLYAPALRRDDARAELGPIIGVVDARIDDHSGARRHGRGRSIKAVTPEANTASPNRARR
ncbi:MAG: phosphodiester glycosidase family protein [Proteobacteria bacterium]|nr:phosphodiester glycosidase family protein [Pseudomonadota bacterium]